MVTVLFLVVCVVLVKLRPTLVAVSFAFLVSEAIKAVVSALLLGTLLGWAARESLLPLNLAGRIAGTFVHSYTLSILIFIPVAMLFVATDLIRVWLSKRMKAKREIREFLEGEPTGRISLKRIS
jgi:uncharacterized membrane protein YcaP (DUF421 family)